MLLANVREALFSWKFIIGCCKIECSGIIPLNIEILSVIKSNYTTMQLRAIIAIQNTTKNGKQIKNDEKTLQQS